MQEQVIAKLSSLEASMSSGFRRLDEKMDRFQSDLHNTTIDTNAKIAALDKEIANKFEFKRKRIDALVASGETVKEKLEARINVLETWKQVVLGKIAALVTVLTGVWILLAPTIRQIMGVSNGN